MTHAKGTEAAKSQLEKQAKPKGEALEPEGDRTLMWEDIQQYLEVKEQYPDAIALVKSPDQRFYEAFFEGTQPLIEHLEMIGTSMESGVKKLGRVPVAGFPVQNLHKYLDRLTQQQEVVIVDGEGAIAVHTHHPPEPILEELAQSPVEPRAQAQRLRSLNFRCKICLISTSSM